MAPIPASPSAADPTTAAPTTAAPTPPAPAPAAPAAASGEDRRDRLGDAVRGRPSAPPAEAAPAGARPDGWDTRFASAGRDRGPEHADAVRILLLRTARPGPDTLTRLYRHGDAAERRAVLLALPFLASGPELLPLVEDALRTHDTRLLAAAVGPYGAAHLDPHAWRHAVLKCLFTGVPVAAVAELADRARADAELARMLTDFAAERTAAGRPVPADLRRVLALTAPPQES
ncbi:EboA domain-containing protein [Kitasatospora sp. NPDC059327]|uniref:EboA domain-containing protein n=1 Tax=Kitasatospora sp. NPDC059327 TaxID=3346803 RepID=UPI0036A620BF